MNIVLKELLRSDFTKNYLEIDYDEKLKRYNVVYLYNYAHGTISLVDGIKEVHRWESEEEAESASYLSRRYTSVFLDGMVNDSGTEDDIIREVLKYIDKQTISSEEQEIILRALDFIRKY